MKRSLLLVLSTILLLSLINVGCSSSPTVPASDSKQESKQTVPASKILQILTGRMDNAVFSSIRGVLESVTSTSKKPKLFREEKGEFETTSEYSDRQSVWQNQWETEMEEYHTAIKEEVLIIDSRFDIGLYNADDGSFTFSKDFPEAYERDYPIPIESLPEGMWTKWWQNKSIKKRYRTLGFTFDTPVEEAKVIKENLENGHGRVLISVKVDFPNGMSDHYAETTIKIIKAELIGINGDVLYEWGDDSPDQPNATSPGDIIWRFKLEHGSYPPKVTVSDRAVFVHASIRTSSVGSGGTTTLYAIDAKTGELLWKHQIGKTQRIVSPKLAEGLVFVAVRDREWRDSKGGYHRPGVIYSYNSVTGESMWKSGTGYTIDLLLVDTGKVVAYGSEQVSAFDSTTGKLIWESSMEEVDKVWIGAMASAMKMESQPAIIGDTEYSASDDVIYAKMVSP